MRSIKKSIASSNCQSNITPPPTSNLATNTFSNFQFQKKKLYLSPWGNCKARGLVQVIFYNKDKNNLINNNNKGKNQ